MDKKEAETYLQTLTKKLSRIRNYIIANADKKHGKLTPEYQHAVRCTEAGTRELNRCFQIDYGSDGDLRAACLAEQHLKNRDRGDILPFHGRNHLVGVFTCQACDFDYVSDPNGGPPVRRPNSRLCVVCKAGIQHSAVIVEEKALEAAVSRSAYPTPISGQQIAPEPNMSDVEAVVRVYLCDSCAAEDSLALEAEA